MDPSSVGSNGVKKLEDTESPDSKRDVKVKTLNRVPRKSSFQSSPQNPYRASLFYLGACVSFYA